MVIRWVWRLLRWGLAALVVYAVWWYGTAVWDGTEDLRDDVFGAGVPPALSEALVLDAGAGTITLVRTADSQVDGTFGLDADGGYGVAGSIISLSGDRVVRELTSLDGRIAAGETVRLDPFLLPIDVGVGVRDVALSGVEGATNPAWLVPGDNDVWVIFVHGRGTPGRAEVSRLLPLLSDLGYPVLAITIRGDGVAPAPVPEKDEEVIDRWGLDRKNEPCLLWPAPPGPRCHTGGRGPGHSHLRIRGFPGSEPRCGEFRSWSSGCGPGRILRVKLYRLKRWLPPPASTGIPGTGFHGASSLLQKAS